MKKSIFLFCAIVWLVSCDKNPQPPAASNGDNHPPSSEVSQLTQKNISIDSSLRDRILRLTGQPDAIIKNTNVVEIKQNETVTSTRVLFYAVTTIIPDGKHLIPDATNPLFHLEIDISAKQLKTGNEVVANYEPREDGFRLISCNLKFKPLQSLLEITSEKLNSRLQELNRLKRAQESAIEFTRQRIQASQMRLDEMRSLIQEQRMLRLRVIELRGDPSRVNAMIQDSEATYERSRSLIVEMERTLRNQRETLRQTEANIQEITEIL